MAGQLCFICLFSPHGKHVGVKVLPDIDLLGLNPPLSLSPLPLPDPRTLCYPLGVFVYVIQNVFHIYILSLC